MNQKFENLTIDDLEANYIINLVSKRTDVSFSQMKDKTRKHEIVNARHIAMFAIWLNGNLSLKKIGKKFGNRDHSTVIHAKDSVIDFCDTDYIYRGYIKSLIQEINPSLQTKLESLIKLKI